MPSPSLMPICGTCGVIAPRRCPACETCGAKFAEPRLWAPRLDGARYWVAVRCTFQCRSCSFASPLDQLDVDGSVECAYCQLRQRFEPSTWKGALEFAQAVGDLSGPELEGRFPDPSLWIGTDNPFRDVGETLTFSELRQSGMEQVDGMMIPQSLQIRAAPGFPVCRRCKIPLQVALLNDGRAVTSCSSCPDGGTYALPDRARQFGESLVAVVAEEHRVDQVIATRAAPTNTGASALSCPSCGAPLDLRGGDRTVKCQFCGGFCRVPGRFLVRTGQGTIEPEIWWMLLSGPSPQRRELEGEAVGAVPQSIELPLVEQSARYKYKQWALNVTFLLGAIWIGFEIASIDFIHDLTIPDSARVTTIKGKAGVP